ncbi:hypothetical protein EYC80_004312 [Monilinia laxa]|uniref:MACPF domain-containing protein n=1 Tax=Monilinia laxa TaxID=61186 RepID=A0A5N6KMM7_MONLA|nr:hypothetical protein EYC80_004312 [Monilinia laxa]
MGKTEECQDKARNGSEHEELLPICTTVSYTVNLLPKGVDPFNLSVALERDRKYNLLKHVEPGKTITIPGSERKYVLPSNFEKHDMGSVTVTHSLICRTGSELANDVSVDASASANYAGFSAEANAGLDQKNYSINVLNKKVTYDSIDQEYIEAATRLPSWKKISKELADFAEITNIYKKFAKFYSRYGSHLIQKGYMGTRYQLEIEQQETSEESKEAFSLHVKAEYQGAIGGSVSVDVKKSESYKQYTSQRKSDCKVLGGDAGKSGTLSHLSLDDAVSYNAAFKEWQESRKDGATDALLHLRVKEMGNFLQDSHIEAQVEVGVRISDAWSYFKDFYTSSGEVSLFNSREAGIIKLEVTALPGLEMRLSGKGNVRITHRKPSIVEVEILSGSIVEDINLTIVAPDRPVELLFSIGKTAQMALLLLNKYGPEKYRTGFNASPKTQSVRSYQHEIYLISINTKRTPLKTIEINVYRLIKLKSHAMKIIDISLSKTGGYSCPNKTIKAIVSYDIISKVKTLSRLHNFHPTITENCSSLLP